ncbi:MAG TPA: PAS domain-containing protein, partial [Solirubrobacterales bacterium]|nr:PAS domain-containing protein [Solirubrobacterales bacterium]
MPTRNQAQDAPEETDLQQLWQEERRRREVEQGAQSALAERNLMCMISGDGRIVRLEGDWREVLGWERAELVGRQLDEHLHPDDRESTVRELVSLS